jgi:class 3 adenylate cyclase/thioredoxin-like negative regulator of GroEL
MSSPSRRLTTLWFADIAGFTRLSATDEPTALKVMEVMRRCVKTAVAAQHGTVIKYLGDGALAEFPSAEGAVSAALEAGARFVGGTLVFPGGPFQLHIGIHVGDVAVSKQGEHPDVFGDGVNRAARLQALGQPGEILVSEEVFALVRRNPQLKFTSLGERTAKGLDEPFVVYAVEPSGELSANIAMLSRGLVDTPRAPVRMVRYPRTIGVGMLAGVATFIGLALYSAIGGTPSVVATAPLPIPDTLRLPAPDSAFAMPAWPPPAPRVAARPVVANRTSNLTASPIAPPPPPANSLAALAQSGEQFLARMEGRDLSGHESLPLLRRALNEARDGAPSGARADAIRAMVIFLVAREVERAEDAFHASLAEDPESGFTRVMYAHLLTASGRFGEASFQLGEAKDRGVTNALVDATRGAALFREGKFGPAKDALERSIRADDQLSTAILLARTLIAQGKTDDALRVLDRKIGSFEVVPWMAYARQKAGRGPGANHDRLVEMASRPDAGYGGALLLLAADEPAQAVDALERLARNRDPDLIWLGVDPEWAPLRSDLRFNALVNRVLIGR